MFILKTPLLHLLLGSTLLAMTSLGCTAKSVKKRDRPYVVSTTSIMKDLVDTLWGEQVESVSLMGPGVDPHLYQPTAQDLIKLEEAEYIIAHGLHLEGRMVEAIEALSHKKKVLVVGDRIDPSLFLKADNAIDPHTWFDPELWIQSAQILAKNPPVPTFTSPGLEPFIQKVREISNRYKVAFQKIPLEKRVLITSHDAFQYLGRFFEIEVWGIQGVSTDSEVGVKRIDELIAMIKKRKIKSIYSETSVSPRSIEKLMSESGAKSGGVLYSDALGPLGSGADTYSQMLEHNLKIILEGLL